MATFTFEVRKAETIRHLVESVSLQNPSDAWAMVEQLSRRFDDPGSHIVVKEETGEIVICVGIATARKAFQRRRVKSN